MIENNYERETGTNALLNRDIRALEEYKFKKSVKKNINTLEKEVVSMKREIEILKKEIESLKNNKTI